MRSYTLKAEPRRGSGPIALLFLAPFLLLFLVFHIGPVVASLVLSFTSYDGLSRPVWVGLANYSDILFGTEAATRLFWKSVVNTLYYTGGELTLEASIGLALALLGQLEILRVQVGPRGAARG